MILTHAQDSLFLISKKFFYFSVIASSVKQRNAVQEIGIAVYLLYFKYP